MLFISGVQSKSQHFWEVSSELKVCVSVEFKGNAVVYSGYHVVTASCSHRIATVQNAWVIQALEHGR